jgi:type I restriction enzyme R subunit
VRAQLRVLVKRIPRKHGYPPDGQEKATQAVLVSGEWAAAGRWACDSDRYPVREAGQGPVEFGAPARSDHL